MRDECAKLAAEQDSHTAGSLGLCGPAEEFSGEAFDSPPANLCGQTTEDQCFPGCCKVDVDRPVVEADRLETIGQATTFIQELAVKIITELVEGKTAVMIHPGEKVVVLPIDLPAEKLDRIHDLLDEDKPESILDEASRIVSGARRGSYGHPENNFGRIAALWQAYLDGKPEAEQGIITPQDTALMIILVKVARLLESPRHRDSVVDIAGYAATIEMLWEGQDAAALKLMGEL